MDKFISESDHTFGNLDKSKLLPLYQYEKRDSGYQSVEEKNSLADSLKNELDEDHGEENNKVDEKLVNALKKLQFWKKIIILVVSIVGFTFACLTEFGFIPPMKSEFLCGDPSLSHQFKGETISPIILVLVSVFLSMIILGVREKCDQIKNITTVLVLIYIEGLISVLVINAALKLIFGKPRPHFFNTCKPYEANNCTNQVLYTFQCTTYDEYSSKFVRDSYLSFPSGHSTISSYIAVYLSLLVYKMKLKAPCSKWKLPLILICIFYSILVSISRVTDGRHHLADVVCGAGLGVIGAVSSFIFLQKSLS